MISRAAHDHSDIVDHFIEHERIIRVAAHSEAFFVSPARLLDVDVNIADGLRDTIGGISDKVLTDTLNRLLGHGLVERRSYAEAPPRVDYALTPLGTSLVEGPLRALATWTRVHGDDLLAAQSGGDHGGE